MTTTSARSKAFEEQLIHSVKSVISDRIDKECQKAIEAAKKRVEESVAEVVASVSLRIMKRVSFEYRADELIVRVRMETGNENN